MPIVETTVDRGTTVNSDVDLKDDGTRIQTDTTDTNNLTTTVEENPQPDGSTEVVTTTKGTVVTSGFKVTTKNGVHISTVPVYRLRNVDTVKRRIVPAKPKVVEKASVGSGSDDPYSMNIGADASFIGSPAVFNLPAPSIVRLGSQLGPQVSLDSHARLPHQIIAGQSQFFTSAPQLVNPNRPSILPQQTYLASSQALRSFSPSGLGPSASTPRNGIDSTVSMHSFQIHA